MMPALILLTDRVERIWGDNGMCHSSLNSSESYLYSLCWPAAVVWSIYLSVNLNQESFKRISPDETGIYIQNIKPFILKLDIESESDLMLSSALAFSIWLVLRMMILLPTLMQINLTSRTSVLHLQHANVLDLDRKMYVCVLHQVQA